MSLSRLCWALTTILLANSAASISSQLSKNLLRRNSTELAAADLTSACQVSQWWCKQMRRLNLLVTTKMTKTKMRHKLATLSNSQWVQPLKRARILRETIKSQLLKESIELLQLAKWAEKSLRLKLRDVSTDYQLALDRFGPKKRSPDDLLVCRFWPKVCLPLLRPDCCNMMMIRNVWFVKPKWPNISTHYFYQWMISDCLKLL